jgi:hypothetical protein
MNGSNLSCCTRFLGRAPVKELVKQRAALAAGQVLGQIAVCGKEALEIPLELRPLDSVGRRLRPGRR